MHKSSKKRRHPQASGRNSDPDGRNRVPYGGQTPVSRPPAACLFPLPGAQVSPLGSTPVPPGGQKIATKGAKESPADAPPAAVAGGSTCRTLRPTARDEPHALSFSKSRISVSNCSSREGAGGAGGAAGFSLFFLESLAISLTKRKIEKAMTRKSKEACRKLP